MHEFKTYHPFVNFTYFMFVIGLGCFLMHPVCLGISLFCSFLYLLMLKGKKSVLKIICFLLPMAFLTAIINPAFNHEGITVLSYLPSGNPLTLESIIYGICAAAMLSSVVLHFSCHNEVMTSDKFIYLFGKVIPAMSLIISMTLRFVPRLLRQLKIVVNAQKALGRDMTKGSILKRAKCGLNILSIITTWAFENSIETADSMKARGYGIPGRTSFSIYTFDKRDIKALILIITAGAYTLYGSIRGALEFNFFPSIKSAEISLFGVSVFISYALLSMCPLIIEFLEVRRWNFSRSKI